MGAHRNGVNESTIIFVVTTSLYSLISGQSPHFCHPQFPHLQNRDNEPLLCTSPWVLGPVLGDRGCGSAPITAKGNADAPASGPRAWQGQRPGHGSTADLCVASGRDEALCLRSPFWNADQLLPQTHPRCWGSHGTLSVRFPHCRTAAAGLQ